MAINSNMPLPSYFLKSLSDYTDRIIYDGKFCFLSSLDFLLVVTVIYLSGCLYLTFLCCTVSIQLPFLSEEKITLSNYRRVCENWFLILPLHQSFGLYILKLKNDRIKKTLHKSNNQSTVSLPSFALKNKSNKLRESTLKESFDLLENFISELIRFAIRKEKELLT